MVVYEDIHWAAASELDLLEYPGAGVPRDRRSS